MRISKKTKSEIIEQGKAFTHNFFVTLCECHDILASSRRYRSIGSWESALDDMRHKEIFDKLKAKKALRNLRDKKWLEMRRKGQELEVRMTDKGEVALLYLQANQEQKPLPLKQQCYVFYDFPVGANKARDKFRYHLKQCGFKKFQDSVWVSDKDLVDYVVSFVNRLGIANWVKIIVGKDLLESG